MKAVTPELTRKALAYSSQGYKTYAQINILGTKAVVQLLHVLEITPNRFECDTSLIFFRNRHRATQAINEAVNACPDLVSPIYTVTDWEK